MEAKTAFRDWFLGAPGCVLGNHGQTHRARYPDAPSLDSPQAQGDVLAKALRLQSAAALVEVGHAQNRQEIRGGRDCGFPPTVDRLAARFMLREALNRALMLARRTDPQARADAAAPGAAAAGAAGAAAAGAGAAGATKRPRGSWTFRVYWSRCNLAGEKTRSAYKQKALWFNEGTFTTAGPLPDHCRTPRKRSGISLTFLGLGRDGLGWC